MGTLAEDADRVAEEAAASADDTANQEASNLLEAANTVARSWSESNLGYQAAVYYGDFEPPPAGRSFDREWGLSGMGFNNMAGWRERSFDEVNARVDALAGQYDRAGFADARLRAVGTLERLRADLESIVSAAASQTPGDTFLERQLAAVQTLRPLTVGDVRHAQQAVGTVHSRDPRWDGTLQQAPHQQAVAQAVAVTSPFERLVQLAAHARQVAAHLRRLAVQDPSARPTSDADGNNLAAGREVPSEAAMIDPMSMPKPKTDDEQELLQEIWDQFSARDTWPAFGVVDRRLYQRSRMDAAAVLKGMPQGLIYGGRDYVNGDSVVALTVAGAAACRGSEEDLRAFLQVVQHAATVELGWTEEGFPTITDADVVKALPLPAAGRAQLLTRIGALGRVERWGWDGAGERPGGGWQFHLSREVRAFSGVETVEDYWSRKVPLDPPVHYQLTVESLMAGDDAVALDEVILPEAPADAGNALAAGTTTQRPTIFLVHGHDTSSRDLVELQIRRWELEPRHEIVILDRAASRGMTLLEKFEQYAVDAGIAIVLATPDDEGRAKSAGGPLLDRARQNVIFELGYFMARLGRGHVILLNGGVEQPSDVRGLVYLDLSGDWQSGMAREFEALGLQGVWTNR